MNPSHNRCMAKGNPLSSIFKNIVEVYASIQNGLNFGT